MLHGCSVAIESCPVSHISPQFENKFVAGRSSWQADCFNAAGADVGAKDHRGDLPAAWAKENCKALLEQRGGRHISFAEEGGGSPNEGTTRDANSEQARREVCCLTALSPRMVHSPCGPITHQALLFPPPCLISTLVLLLPCSCN
eukprot:95707-Rhodomonas_salina.1